MLHVGDDGRSESEEWNVRRVWPLRRGPAHATKESKGQQDEGLLIAFGSYLRAPSRAHTGAQPPAPVHAASQPSAFASSPALQHMLLKSM